MICKYNYIINELEALHLGALWLSVVAVCRCGCLSVSTSTVEMTLFVKSEGNMDCRFSGSKSPCFNNGGEFLVCVVACCPNEDFL